MQGPGPSSQQDDFAQAVIADERGGPRLGGYILHEWARDAHHRDGVIATRCRDLEAFTSNMINKAAPPTTPTAGRHEQCWQLH